MTIKLVLRLIATASLCTSFFFVDYAFGGEETFEFLKSKTSDEVLAVRPKVDISFGAFAARTKGKPTSPHINIASSDPVLSSDVVLDMLAKKYSVFIKDAKSELRPVSSDVDSLGNTRVIYNQMHKGVNVLGKQVSVYFDKNGKLLFIKGSTNKNITMLPVAKFSAQNAIDTTKNLMSRTSGFKKARKVFKAIERKRCAKIHNARSTASRCVASKLRKFEQVFRPTLKTEPKLYIKRDSDGKDRLVWHLALAKDPESKDIFQVDAISGEVVLQEQDIDHATETYPYAFDCGHNLPAYDTCYLNYFTTTTGVEFFLGRSPFQPARGPSPMPGFQGSTDVDFFFDDIIPSIHNYYVNKFGRNGANGFGGTLIESNVQGTVDRTFVLVNSDNTTTGRADCNLGFVNGWRTTNGLQFCKGARSPDLIGHEYAHNATLALSRNVDNVFVGLSRTGQSGTIDEAFGDFMGESFERFRTGTNDWKFMPEAGMLSRDFGNPANTTYTALGDQGAPRPHPDRYNSPNFYCGAANMGGKHYNATVLDKAFYLMSQGGSFNGCNVSGIGFAKAEQIIARAMFTYVSPTESFNDFYHSVTQACTDFVGMNYMFAPGEATTPTFTASDCAAVATALQAVELDQAGPCSGGINVGNNTPATCTLLAPDPEPTAIPTATATIAPTSTPVTPRDNTDVNRDGVTDLEDLHRIFMMWGDTNPSFEDINFDAVVDILDYNLFYQAYYKPDFAGVYPPAPAPALTIPGDCSRDGAVDGGDFLAFQRSFGLTGPALACDFNFDRIVDSLDLDVWRANYGNRVGQ